MKLSHLKYEGCRAKKEKTWWDAVKIYPKKKVLQLKELFHGKKITLTLDGQKGKKNMVLLIQSVRFLMLSPDLLPSNLQSLIGILSFETI